MDFRLRQIDVTSDGREIVRERVVAKAELTVGRSSECDIHLPDLAVEALHARIRPLGEGRIRIEAAGTLGFSLDGADTRAAVVDVNDGAELGLGRYRIAIAPGHGGAALLTVQRRSEPEGGEALDAKTSFSISRAMPRKRLVSWILAVGILLAFLAVPIASNLTRRPDSRSTVAGDGAWSAGPLSLAHHALETRCEACHAKPFEAVRDKACLTCHKDSHDHALPSRIARARPEMGLGGQFLAAVAHGFGKPGAGSCTSCHVEHEGARALVPRSARICTDCHAGLDRRLADARLGNAADFGTVHPQFRAAVPAAAGSSALRRVSLADGPREVSGLIFPHRLHLDPLGGAARMAAKIGMERGYGSRMACKDCHRPTEDGVRFQPIDMERDCEACHSLAYDRVGGTFRTLHHGDVEQMKADLRAMPRGQAIVTGRHRPGQFAMGGLYYSSFAAPAGSEAMIDRALSREGICGECHVPVAGRGGMTILPVRQVTRFFPNAWFDHKAHRQEACTTCHAAGRSSRSTDLLLPGIKQCRTCHLGEHASKAKVPSSCVMCHAYHPKDLPPRESRLGRD